jgi:hypothetical protein
LRNASAKQLELQQLKGERDREREDGESETAAGLYAALGRVVWLCAGRCVERVADRQGCMPPLKQTQINPPIYLFLIFKIYEFFFPPLSSKFFLLPTDFVIFTLEVKAPIRRWIRAGS